MYKNFEDNMILVIDDFIDKEYQEKIKNTLIGGTDNKNKHHESEFPWYFIEDVTAAGDEGNQQRAGFGHQYVFMDDNDISHIESVYHHLFTPLLGKACQYLKMPETKVLQGDLFYNFHSQMLIPQWLILLI